MSSTATVQVRRTEYSNMNYSLFAVGFDFTVAVRGRSHYWLDFQVMADMVLRIAMFGQSLTPHFPASLQGCLEQLIEKNKEVPSEYEITYGENIILLSYGEHNSVPISQRVGKG